MKARALMVFAVCHNGIRIRVRLLPSASDVHSEYIAGYKRMRGGLHVHAFFSPTSHAAAHHLGTIVLPSNGRLEELIPHEVTHAVMHKFGGVHCSDDEALATAIGILSARIARKIARGVTYEA